MVDESRPIDSRGLVAVPSMPGTARTTPMPASVTAAKDTTWGMERRIAGHRQIAIATAPIPIGNGAPNRKIVATTASGAAVRAHQPTRPPELVARRMARTPNPRAAPGTSGQTAVVDARIVGVSAVPAAAESPIPGP